MLPKEKIDRTLDRIAIAMFFDFRCSLDLREWFDEPNRT